VRGVGLGDTLPDVLLRPVPSGGGEALFRPVLSGDANFLPVVGGDALALAELGGDTLFLTVALGNPKVIGAIVIYLTSSFLGEREVDLGRLVGVIGTIFSMWPMCLIR